MTAERADALKAAANRKAREEKKKAVLQAIRARYREQLRALDPADSPALAHRMHIAIDEVLARDRAKDRSSGAIRCRKGCDHCCRVPVEIFPEEAALLVRSARDAGLHLDADRLQRQSRYGIDDWNAQPTADRACVFLGADGDCRVYAYRPNACRKLLVLTAPAFCDAEKHPAERVDRWISWEAEVLASTALETLGAQLMPVALLAALRAQDDA